MIPDPHPAIVPLLDRIDTLRAEVARLEAENQRLHAENARAVGWVDGILSGRLAETETRIAERVRILSGETKATPPEEVEAAMRSALATRRRCIEQAHRVLRAIRLMAPEVRPGANTIELVHGVHMGEVFDAMWRLGAELETDETWNEPETKESR